MSVIKTSIRLLLVCCLAGLLPGAARAATLTYTTDLALWLASDLGVTTSGSTVTGWADQSGNGHDGSYTSGEPQVGPTINGLPTISFSGNTDHFDLAGGQVLTSDNFTIFTVAVDTGPANGDSREIYSNWDGSNSWSSTFIGTTSGTDPVRSARLTDGLLSVDQVLMPATPFILWGAYQGGVNAELFYNGNSIGSNPQNNLPADGLNPNGQRDLTTPSFIGQQGSFTGEYWQGQIAEVLVYNALLTPEQQAEVFSYLQEKWTPVPEPASVVLIALGALSLAMLNRRHRARA
jgi:hypothetical protein